ncbi:carbohydrate porin [Novosphingobium album (ex Liu et al. 2023)]|uniref:Carbohydrate porin n=1 Tax=Novosphingobium album (ex Liu et al. 2023) TaxID=3031130 RepID=A0ABT5WJP3_9SPHN|nr:carbohydrate porin [Novosphingobium album (ex Liu et al. 2023)]MDE8650265.1 carbohydrate porin [Novosphingobium album (ex Liu et al. 2023)]
MHAPPCARKSGAAHAAALGGIAALALIGAPARADAPVALSATYTADIGATLSGGADHRARYLDNLDITADTDLDTLLDWQGARAHVHVLNNMGKRPNDGAGTLQGVDNIEVGKAAPRLYEAWIEQDIGKASLRAGLYDLNSEFYASDTAGLLIAPPFGIGSELAAAGPNGPSIFPSTALSLRLRAPIGEDAGYVEAAAINAHASTLGDHGGVDFSFDDGLLLIGEAGHALGPARLSGGVWAYTRKRDSYFAIGPAGDPVRHRSWGAYAGLEAPLATWGERRLDGFARAGFSDGHTTPYAYGVQAGVLLAPALGARPDSAFSLGTHFARANREFRRSVRCDGHRAAGGEFAIEATYADKLTEFVTLQPDVQIIGHPSAIRGVPVAVVGTLRVTIAFATGA